MFLLLVHTAINVLKLLDLLDLIQVCYQGHWQSSGFNEIWCADSNYASKDGHMKKCQNFGNSKWRDGRHIDNRFSAISQRPPFWKWFYRYISAANHL